MGDPVSADEASSLCFRSIVSRIPGPAFWLGKQGGREAVKACDSILNELTAKLRPNEAFVVGIVGGLVWLLNSEPTQLSGERWHCKLVTVGAMALRI